MVEKKIDPANGTIRYFLDGVLHREDGPAAIYPNGTKEYYKHGVLHRLDGAALIHKYGTETWYKDGKIHRDSDAPAFSDMNGTKYYYKNGELYRDNDGAAVEYRNGTEEYWTNGKIVKIIFNDTEYTKYMNMCKTCSIKHACEIKCPLQILLNKFKSTKGKKK